MLDPAAAPEGDRGEPVPPPRPPRCGERMGDARGGAREAHRLRQRRDARVPRGRGPRALVPRDEHAAPGRAPGDRDGDRRRPREGADPDRAGRAAAVPAGGPRASAGTPSSAASTPRTPTPASCPSPGTILALRVPGGPGVRDDSGVYEGWTVPIDYDPLLSKLVVWAESRDEAVRRMRRAVAEYRVVGVKTTLPFFERVLAHPAFVAGDFDTSFLDTALAAGETPAGASGRDRGRGGRHPRLRGAAGGAPVAGRRRRPAPRPGARPGAARPTAAAWGARVDLRRDRRGPHDPRGGARRRRALLVEPRRLAPRGGPRPRRAATSRASSSPARATRSASRSARRASSSTSRATR